MKRKELFYDGNGFNKNYNQIVAYADFFDNVLSENNNVLLVGTGYYDDQYYDWCNALLRVEPTIKISYLEVSDVYINKWKNGQYPIIKGDVRKIDEVIVNDEFDVICWIQGPEHIKQEEMANTFEKIFNVAKKAVIFSCPWGNYYDFQEELHGNVYEKHLNKSMGEHCFIGKEFDSYNIQYYDGKDTGSGCIMITKIK